MGGARCEWGGVVECVVCGVVGRAECVCACVAGCPYHNPSAQPHQTAAAAEAHLFQLLRPLQLDHRQCHDVRRPALDGRVDCRTFHVPPHRTVTSVDARKLPVPSEKCPGGAGPPGGRLGLSLPGLRIARERGELRMGNSPHRWAGVSGGSGCRRLLQKKK